MKRIIKDPTYNIYSKGGSVETRKNRLTKEDLKLLASESPREEFELDLGSILEELKDWKKQNPDKDEMDFYKEKGIAIKRIELDKGGVVSLSDYLKQKQKPKIKKIDLAQGDFEKTVASLTINYRSHAHLGSFFVLIKNNHLILERLSKFFSNYLPISNREWSIKYGECGISDCLRYPNDFHISVFYPTTSLIKIRDINF